MTPVRVILADDHPALRAGVRAVLTVHGRIDVVAEAAGGEEALRLVRQFTPDVVLLDVEMPDLDGVEVAERLRAGRLGHARARVLGLRRPGLRRADASGWSGRIHHQGQAARARG